MKPRSGSLLKPVLSSLLSATSLLCAWGQAPSGPAGSPRPAESVNPKDPVLNFEHVWKTLDRNYAQFGVKHVDWDALYRLYRPQVTQATTDKELWDILLAMMGHLNDGHVCLADGKRRICAGLNEGFRRDDFSLDLVKSKYLQGRSSVAMGGSYVSGWLPGEIGYIYIRDFKDGIDPTVKTIDSLQGEFAKAKAMIVDVRNNPGGTGRAVEAVAGRFTDRRRHYMTTQIRYGRKHEDMWPDEYQFVEPAGPLQFTRPTLVLSNRASASGADIFVLAMRVLPHVTVVGDLTEGACSAQFPERLPNGWTLWVAFKVLRDPNGTCWDGVGIPPDLRAVNTAEDITAGRDRVLDFAVQFLERGMPGPQEESGSQANLKVSLVDAYVRCARDKGTASAITWLDQARQAKSATTYFGIDEAMQQASHYLARKQYAEVIGLLKACRQEYPRLASTYSLLAQAYLGSGDVAAAEGVLKDGEKVEAMFLWETSQMERTKLLLRKAKQGSAAEVLGKALDEGGIPAAEKAMKEMAAHGQGGPVMDENDFNVLGYRLLQAKRLDQALFIFEQNVGLYPGSWNAWDSLGEVAAEAGRIERAITCYRKSLELNPGNRSGRARLEALEKGMKS